MSKRKLVRNRKPKSFADSVSRTSKKRVKYKSFAESVDPSASQRRSPKRKPFDWATAHKGLASRR